MGLAPGMAQGALGDVTACDDVSRADSVSGVSTSCVSPVSTPIFSHAGPPPSLELPPPIESLQCLKLTDEQLAKVKALRAVVDAFPIVEEIVDKRPAEKERGWFTGLFNRSSSNVTKGEVTSLTWDEVLWLMNDMVLYRYLRSYSWDQSQAQQQLMQTVCWRRNRKPHCIRPTDVMATAARGSVYRKGFDVHGHPIVYFK